MTLMQYSETSYTIDIWAHPPMGLLETRSESQITAWSLAQIPLEIIIFFPRILAKHT